jgi:hypothetical protein
LAKYEDCNTNVLLYKSTFVEGNTRAERPILQNIGKRVAQAGALDGTMVVIRKNYGNEFLMEGHYTGLDHL